MANPYDDGFERMLTETFSALSPTTGGTRTLANSPAPPGDNQNDNDGLQADSYNYWGASGLENMVPDSGDRYSFPTEILQSCASNIPVSLDQINDFFGDSSSDIFAYFDQLSRMGNVENSFFNVGQNVVSDLPDFHPAVNGLPISERHIGSTGANVSSSLAPLHAFPNYEMKNYSGRVPLSRENQVASVNPSSRSGHINFASQPGFDFTLADPNSYSNSINPAVDLYLFNSDITGPNYPEEAELMAGPAFSDSDSPNTLSPVSPPELVPDEHHQKNASSLARTGKTVRWDRGFGGVKKIEKQKIVNALSSQIIVFDSIQGRSSKNPRLPFSFAKRREVAAVRAKGACFKCKMKRKKCDLGTPCRNCTEDPERCTDPTVMISQPCFRLNLEQCGFFRTESALWSRPLRKVMKWVSDSPVRLSIQFIPFYKPGPVLEINCCHFTPEENDIVVRKVGPGNDQVMSIPTYCAPDLDVLQGRLPSSVGGYLKFILKWHSEDIPEMVARALHISLKRAEKETNTILHAALRIWAGSRLCAAPRTLCGEKTLGLDRVQAVGAHDNGFIPIPPMLDYQLDSMMIDWMKELMNTMLKELWKVLLKKGTHRKESWFDVFLTIFLLVNNLEYVYEDQMNFINSHGGAGVGYSGQHIATYSGPMLDLWKWSAEHLIYVFRYYIKKCAFGDAPIFSDVCFDDAVAAANLDESAQAYIRCIIEWVEGEGSGPQAREGNARDRDGKYQMVWCRKLLLNTEFLVSLM